MKITKITLAEARAMYKDCTHAMKCNYTGSVTFECDNFGTTVIIKVIPTTSTVTMTNRSEWRDDLFTSTETTYGQTILKG